ncbi:MAG: hypothetical protein NTW19_07300 [Planctomycetota bacterium]|nr:hypothetical protein [Planctomycetota bacterium]
MRQRLVIGAAASFGLAALLMVRLPLTPANGSSGLSLLDARVGPVAATLLAIAACLPAIILGSVAAASGSSLAGAFVLAFSLATLAVVGGPISGWLWRANIPSAYKGLIVEVLVWQAILIVAFIIMQRCSAAIRRRFPAIAPPGAPSAAADPHVHFPGLQTLGAGVICAMVAGLVASLLLPNGNVGQVVGALSVGFAIGGMVGHLVLPHANVIGLLASPSLVAIVAYAYAGMHYNSADALLTAWYGQKLPGLALVLPIYYASAAVAAVAAGIGIAQSLDSSRLQVAPD